MTALYECGMLAKKEEEWLACSPNGVALINLEDFGLKSGSSEDSGTLASVEIKTNVAESSLDRLMQNATVDVLSCKVREGLFLELIPREHAGQLLHQMVVMAVKYVVYVAASESGILFTAGVYCRQSNLNFCYEALSNVAGPLVAWAYGPDPRPPEFADDCTAEMLKLRLPFWTLVNSYVKENDAFPPEAFQAQFEVQLCTTTPGGR